MIVELNDLQMKAFTEIIASSDKPNITPEELARIVLVNFVIQGKQKLVEAELRNGI